MTVERKVERLVDGVCELAVSRRFERTRDIVSVDVERAESIIARRRG